MHSISYIFNFDTAKIEAYKHVVFVPQNSKNFEGFSHATYFLQPPKSLILGGSEITNYKFVISSTFVIPSIIYIILPNINKVIFL